jgi:hypothetical protein
MYQLILHHIYRNGPYAIDLSGAENDGLVTAVSYQHNGVSSGSGALVFKSPHSRVRVPPKPIWRHLLALKIEIVVRVDAFGQRRNLVEGDDSFSFFVDPAGYLWGTFNGPQYAGGPLTWHGANSRDNSPDGIGRKVPANKWVTLRFEHDGYASVRLFIDDSLVAASYSIVAGVLPVSPAGVNIGTWTLSDTYTLDGAIDEVKIYRYDPDDMLGHFLCRPLDKKSAACWAVSFDWLTNALRDPGKRNRILDLMKCIAEAQNEAIRLLRSKGEDAITKNKKLSSEYHKLWCEKPIDGREMRQWQEEWFKLMIDTIGRDAWESLIRHVQTCLMRSELLRALPEFAQLKKCDPDFAGYLMGFDLAADKVYGKGEKNYDTY